MASSCIMSSDEPPAARVGAELRVDSDDYATSTTSTGTIYLANRIANQRALRAASIKRKVSSSKSSASRPFINGAIISLVIYNVFQIFSTNIQILNVLNTDTWFRVPSTAWLNSPDHLLTTNTNYNNERCSESASQYFNLHWSHDCDRLNSFPKTDIASLLAEPKQQQQHHKNTILTKFDSPNRAVTSSSTQRQETSTQRQNNDEVARSFMSSSEPEMIYEASRMLEQLLQSIIRNLLKIFTDVFGQLKFMQQRQSGSSFGNFVLFAQAAQVKASSLSSKPNSDSKISKENNVIVLNVTNFNEELIQDKHPFPHIKLIEYYLPFCTKCRKFKSTFVNLSKEVYLWRNVIRPSAVDLSVATNGPIAHSWSIEFIPTLRIHPPPSEELSNKLQSKYNLWSKEHKQEVNTLQDLMYREYSNSMPLVKTFEATKYIQDTTDKSGSQLLRSDLLEYIYSFVEQISPTQLPKTWPNFKPVTETRLQDLMRKHQRKELFLIVEQKSPSSLNSSSKISSGFQTVMDLSSTSAYKAIRYMYASENPELLKEIISSYASSQKSTPETAAAIATLTSLLKPEALSDAEQQQHQSTTTESSNNNNNNNNNDNNNNNSDNSNKLVLVHIDLTHQNNNTLTTIHPIPFVHIVTPTDLIKFEAQHNEEQQQMSSSAATTALLSPLHNNRLLLRRLDSSVNRLNRRQIAATVGMGQLTNEATTTTNDAQSKQAEQQQRDQQQFSRLSPEQRIKLISLYINEIYTPQPEDKAFVDGLAKLDENPTSSDNKLESLKLRRRASSDDLLDGSSSNSAGSIIGEQLKAVSRLFKSASPDKSSANGSNNLTDANANKTVANNNSVSSGVDANFISRRNEGASDYNDKLKAIRYILFTEVPRRLMNPSDNREKIRTLLELITVIKHYFPLPDSASIQFIDGLHRYLSDYLYQSQTIAYQYTVQAHFATELNAQMFKRELKRLESEGKRLPEIQEWSYCGSSGYACGLWRLFHTLTAFEYKKLSQISSQQQTQQQQQQATPSAQYLSKGSNQQAESEYLHSNILNESRQSQQLQQLQKHQQLVKLTPASQAPIPATATAPAALPATPTAATNTTTTKAVAADKSIHNRNSNNNGNSTTPPSSTVMINEVTMPSPVERVVSPPATSTSLSLTIATPTSSNGRRAWGTSSDGTVIGAAGSKVEDAELPTPVLLVMRDYVINYFSCEECAKNFRKETANLSLDRIVQFEKPEFSILWLWEAHNRISKRLSVNNETNPQRPRDWYPSYKQCNQCYKRPPSYLNDPTADSAVIFRESVEWDKEEILRFLIAEYTKTPMDNGLDLFGYQVPYGFVWIVFITCVVIMFIIRCAASYIERQRRHKAATILNGNGVHYSTELQRVS